MSLPARPLPSPASVPTLDDIVRNPRLAAALSQSTVRDLLRRCAVAQSILVVELDAENTAPPAAPAPPEDDRMLTASEAAELVRRSVRWLYRNKKKLPFVRRLSPRSFLCSERGIRQWLEHRARFNG